MSGVVNLNNLLRTMTMEGEGLPFTERQAIGAASPASRAMLVYGLLNDLSSRASITARSAFISLLVIAIVGRGGEIPDHTRFVAACLSVQERVDLAAILRNTATGNPLPFTGWLGERVNLQRNVHNPASVARVGIIAVGAIHLLLSKGMSGRIATLQMVSARLNAHGAHESTLRGLQSGVEKILDLDGGNIRNTCVRASLCRTFFAGHKTWSQSARRYALQLSEPASIVAVCRYCIGGMASTDPDLWVQRATAYINVCSDRALLANCHLVLPELIIPAKTETIKRFADVPVALKRLTA